MSKKTQQGGWRTRWIAKIECKKNGDLVSPFLWMNGILIIGLVIALWFLAANRSQLAFEQKEVIEEQLIVTGPRHPLSGRILKEGEEVTGIYAVIVENSTDARPQSGAEDALLVFEAPVEGNITRWLLLYGSDQDVDEIGPVRSARPYFVDWVLGWNALFAHVGGSPEALKMIDLFSVSDLNEFYWAGSFWRSARRYAPHNAYTETSRLAQAWEKIVNRQMNIEERKFVDSREPTEVPHQSVEVIFGNTLYNVDWRYDRESGRYTRYDGSQPHQTASGTPIMADNIAIMFTDIDVIDEIGRKRLDTIGEGDAMVYKNGVQVKAIWKKENRQSIMRFYDLDGEEISWNLGTTWIEVLDKDSMEVMVTD